MRRNAPQSSAQSISGIPTGGRRGPLRGPQAERDAGCPVPLMIFANGFSHVYILISLMQVRTSLVTRMRWSLIAEVWSRVFTITLVRNICGQDARASYDDDEKTFPGPPPSAGGVPGFNPALFAPTDAEFQAPTEGTRMESTPIVPQGTCLTHPRGVCLLGCR